MIILKDFYNTKFDFGTVVTIGAFDGIHLGHQKLLNETIQCAKKNNLKSVIITFKTSPKIFFNKNLPKKLISIEQKYKILEEYKFDYLIEINFDEKFFNITAEKFVDFFLKKQINCKKIFVGYDFKFGKNRVGDFEFLKNFFGENVISVSALKKDNIIISTTQIKTFIKKNEFEQANDFLGYEYFFEGIVEKGRKIGTKLGFPTLNIKYKEELIKIKGVFKTKTLIFNKFYDSISQFGNAPTFDSEEFLIETFVLDFNENLYGKKIKIFPLKFIRKIIKFNSIDELKKRIIIDVKNIK